MSSDTSHFFLLVVCADSYHQQCMDFRNQFQHFWTRNQTETSRSHKRTFGSLGSSAMWTTWSKWSVSSGKCHEVGVRTKERKCQRLNKVPSTACIGNSAESESCNSDCEKLRNWSLDPDGSCPLSGEQYLDIVVKVGLLSQTLRWYNPEAEDGHLMAVTQSGKNGDNVPYHVILGIGYVTDNATVPGLQQRGRTAEVLGALRTRNSVLCIIARVSLFCIIIIFNFHLVISNYFGGMPR
ncbi:hypothetical protein MAR_011557 [Mya arenaria]|uniref:Uncharacterized protein n=1 Tax=Mya arenaria TaxID=6604 RepID=A0ABY7FY79_MYAAR|nr:hypothetical protein MAR_011557 [Mya arenaria]